MYAHRSTASSITAYLDVDGISVRYRTVGTGDPLLLLHGWGGSLDSMAGLMDEFARQYAVIAIDFPGHGDSGLPPQPWGVSDYATNVLHSLDALGVWRPHVMAHSFGGRVVIKLAALHPERVGKLVLVDSAGVPPPRSLGYSLRAAGAALGKLFARYGGAGGKQARRLLYRLTASNDYIHAGPLRETFVKVVNEDLTPWLPLITAPTLLIWGEHDTETPVSSAEIMHTLMPHARLRVLKHAGHFSYIDQFGKFRLMVGRFLREPPEGEVC